MNKYILLNKTQT